MNVRLNAGRQFGMLTVVRNTRDYKNGSRIVVLRCKCGEIVRRTIRSLRKTESDGSVSSCGCIRRKESHYKYLVGTTHGSIRVTEVKYMRELNRTTCICVCKCGNTVFLDPWNVATNKYQSCSIGCPYSPRTRSHGESNANQIYSLYKSYAGRIKIPFNITFDDFIKLSSQSCHHCGLEPLVEWKSAEMYRSGAYTHNKIEYIDRELGYTIGNIVVACLDCAVDYRTAHMMETRNIEESIGSLL